MSVIISAYKKVLQIINFKMLMISQKLLKLVGYKQSNLYLNSTWELIKMPQHHL